ncbi:MAG: fucose isomerase [Thermoprotei archaeon]
MSESRTRIPVLFVTNPEGAIGGPRAAKEWFAKMINEIKSSLAQCCKEVEFSFYQIKDSDDLREAILKEARSRGYLVFVLNSISGLLKPVIQSGKPVVLISETYGGSGDYLLDISEAIERNYPVIGISTRRPYDTVLLRRMVNYLVMLDKLSRSKLLVIVSKTSRYYLSLEYPLSVDLYNLLKQFSAISGASYVLMDSSEFREKYYDKIDVTEAEKVARKWIEESKQNLEENYGEILKSARLYLAIKKAVEDINANAVTLDCIVLRNVGEIDAWPCLAYMQLWYDGIIPVCEADIASTLIIMIGKYLLGINGFITDPAIDETQNEIVYYHCYAPTNPLGGIKAELPYIITPAHLGEKKASIRVLFKPGVKITAIGLSLDERILTIHTAELVGIEESLYACSNKLVAKADTYKIVRRWNRRSGWHRVIFIGDYREEFINAARLLRLKVIEEDR